MKIFLISGCGVLFLVGWTFGGAVAVCDNKGASESVGACHEDVTLCTSWNDETSCLKSKNGGGFLSHEVKEDFPTSCVMKQGNNCNEPLQRCYRTAICLWSDGKCANDPNNTTLWNEKKKREDSACSPVINQP